MPSSARASASNPLVHRCWHHASGGNPFDGARRGSVQVGGRVAQPYSVVRTRDRVAGAGYACSAHTVCRSFPKISSALSVKACGRSRSAKRDGGLSSTVRTTLQGCATLPPNLDRRPWLAVRRTLPSIFTCESSRPHALGFGAGALHRIGSVAEAVPSPKPRRPMKT